MDYKIGNSYNYNNIYKPITEEESDRYLYHYTTVDNALKYILLQKRLRLSPFCNTNDPYENSPPMLRATFFIDPDEIEENYDRLYNQKYREYMRHKEIIRLVCFAQDLPKEHTSIATRAFCKPRMWAQYADNHTGVCLVFDKKKFITEIEKQKDIYHSEITYFDAESMDNVSDHYHDLNLIRNMSMQEIVKQQFQNNKEIYFSKSNDWEQECEYRFITYSEKPIYVDISSSLLGVTLGVGFDRSNYYSLALVLEQYNPTIAINRLSFTGKYEIWQVPRQSINM